jgi:hypothetical protein
MRAIESIALNNNAGGRPPTEACTRDRVDDTEIRTGTYAIGNLDDHARPLHTHRSSNGVVRAEKGTLIQHMYVQKFSYFEFVTVVPKFIGRDRIALVRDIREHLPSKMIIDPPYDLIKLVQTLDIVSQNFNEEGKGAG